MLFSSADTLRPDEDAARMFIEGMNAGVWTWNLQTEEVWWSDAMYHMLGYRSGEVRIDRIHFMTQIVHPQDVAALEAAVQHVISTRASTRVELRLKHRDLGYQWFKCGGKVNFDMAGQPMKLYGSMIHINDRKVLEERVQMVVEGVEAGIWEWDIVHNTIWWSDRLYALLGYDKDEIRTDNGTFLRKNTHPEDREKMLEALQHHLQKRLQYKVELRIRHKTLGYLWFDCAGKCRFDEQGNPVKMIGSMINCNDRKKLEVKMAHSAFLLNETGRISKVGGWEIDLEQNRAYWSKTTYDIHESDYDFEPDMQSALNFFHPDHRQKIVSAIKNACENGRRFEQDLLFVTAKNRTIWVKTYGEPVFGKSGRISKLRGVLMDIDEAKKNELELKHTIELLASKNEQLSNFSHILTHNLRNHAGNVSLIAGMLATETDPAERAEMTENLMRVSERLNGALDDMGDAIRDSEQNTLQKEMLSFSEMYDEIREVLSQTLEANRIRIRATFEVSHIHFPRIYLESILMNLISNAVKYRDRECQPEIGICTFVDRESGRICLECADNGVGIDLALHGDQLFNLYKTFHANQDAHGVGLFLIRTQIESQGGTISVNSTPGKGACFRVCF
ncbi:MAG: PAS domain-containing protein [Mucilaginibacter polytrichastri]|nr:PAS domain-containing protein [Mucilaginibacter polytrichastri]